MKKPIPYCLALILLWAACSEVNKLERHARKGNTEAINLLVAHYMRVDKHHDEEKAIYWAREGARLNDPYAMADLAYLTGSDSPEAWTLLQCAAHLGNEKAMCTLGYKYLYNKNNSDSAFYWVKQALMAGDESANKAMGDFNYKGIGTKQDYRLALYYYKKGCDKGIDNNYACCDSVISLLKTKFKSSGDTLDLRYWTERKKEIVPPPNWK